MTWLRSAAFAVWFFGLTFVMALASLPVRLFAARRVVAYARCWTRLLLAGLRVLCGITWQVTGLEHLPAEGPALIASMHQSAFDTLIWAVLAPRFAYVFKRELLRIPLFGKMLLVTGMIPIDRRTGAAALRDLLRAVDRAVAGQRQIVIFPEGTRVPPGVRAPLQPGVAALAARTGLPVIPVATDSGRFWGRQAFRKRPGVIHIAIQPPIAPGLPRDALLAELRAAFDRGLAGPVDKSVSRLSSRFPAKTS
jgi:1-acyl-sn-glycerol-3-phosphate acyltransferase